MKKISLALVAAVLIPVPADAQRDVSRRSFTFLDDRLVVAVHAETPGQLQVLRGQRGLIEVAARAPDGFAGFGLGGEYTPELSLTAIGSSDVQYVVVVPQHVAVSVKLPGGATQSVPGTSGLATYRWGDGSATAARPVSAPSDGLFVVHAGGPVPALVDVPGLASVRSISVRVEGSDFRITANRPLSLTPGRPDHFLIDVTGDPLDLVVFVPRGTARFELRSGSSRIADLAFGRIRGYCSGTVIQQPRPNSDWLTVFPVDGSLTCRP